MDDEEEEQLPRCCETPLRNKSSENGAVTTHRLFAHRSTQTSSSVLNGDMAPFQGSGRGCGSVDASTAFRAHCGSRGLASLTVGPGAPGTRALFHGNAGFRAHFPALFEPVPDGVQNGEEREADGGRAEEKEDERDVGISVEIEIGRKLREMGDQFQQEHLQLFTHRGQLGLFQLATSIYNFLFPQEGPQNARAHR